MTEEEAKTKWCPFARMAAANEDGSDGPSSNRWLGWDAHGGPAPAACCIASACMAWRVPRNVEKADGFFHENEDREGYCGLAGQP